MALTVAQAETVILNRIRDSSGNAHGEVLLDIMSDMQRVINACYGCVLTDDSFTLTPLQTLYTRANIATDVVRLVEISFQGEPLRRCNWTEWAHSNPRWLHSVGRPSMWDFYGHDVILVTPSPPFSCDVDVRYIPELIDLVAGGNFEIPDPYISLLIDMVCEVLLVRQRLMPSVAEAEDAAARHSTPRIVDESVK